MLSQFFPAETHKAAARPSGGRFDAADGDGVVAPKSISIVASLDDGVGDAEVVGDEVLEVDDEGVEVEEGVIVGVAVVDNVGEGVIDGMIEIEGDATGEIKCEGEGLGRDVTQLAMISGQRNNIVQLLTQKLMPCSQLSEQYSQAVRVQLTD